MVPGPLGGRDSSAKETWGRWKKATTEVPMLWYKLAQPQKRRPFFTPHRRKWPWFDDDGGDRRQKQQQPFPLDPRKGPWLPFDDEEDDDGGRVEKKPLPDPEWRRTKGVTPRMGEPVSPEVAAWGEGWAHGYHLRGPRPNPYKNDKSLAIQWLQGYRDGEAARMEVDPPRPHKGRKNWWEA